jgi:hypothetical protein
MIERQRQSDQERNRRRRSRRIVIAGLAAAGLFIVAVGLDAVRLAGSSDSSPLGTSQPGVVKPSEVRDTPIEIRALQEIRHLLTGK